MKGLYVVREPTQSKPAGNNGSSEESNRPAVALQVAIQGERGSNSHMAALEAFPLCEPVPCGVAAEVFERVAGGTADCAVLPIENSLHGAVFEHYDLLLEHSLHITGESMLRIRHNVVAPPGVRLDEIHRVLSHPVALSQCRRWLRAHPDIEAVPAYDTAGSVKQIMADGVRDAAGIAPMLAAQMYGASVLVEGVEDHKENWTRFYTLSREAAVPADADKMSVAFSLAHQPGTLLRALQVFADRGMDLTRIESRPVRGKPWEYVFFADVRFTSGQRSMDGRDVAAKALGELGLHCERLVTLGMYRAAVLPEGGLAG
jgi:prephenate dehydratase